MDECKRILEEAERAGVTIHLPVDHIQAKRFSENARGAATKDQTISKEHMGLDIGPHTIAEFKSIIQKAKTILWNGPMGVFEWENFAAGSMAIAQAVGANKDTTIVGGGDSISLLAKADMLRSITHVSTGGGAMLEFISGSPMPGIDILRREL